jgi:hypothetical protein
MAIFNSYVSLPEGKLVLVGCSLLSACNLLGETSLFTWLGATRRVKASVIHQENPRGIRMLRVQKTGDE